MILKKNDFSSRLLDQALVKAQNNRKNKLIVLSDSNHAVLCSEIDSFIPVSSVILDNCSFAALENPNLYSFRFLGVFGENLPLFEFYDSNPEELKKRKDESRSAFEDSVFHYSFGTFGKAYAGFLSISRICSDDSAVLFYMNKCKDQLDREGKS